MDPFLQAAIEEAERGLAEGGVPIGENQSFMGEEKWLADHGVELVVVQNPQCIELMWEFMQKYPKLWAEDIGV